MIRLILFAMKLLVIAIFSAATALVVVAGRTTDPVYVAMEIVNWQRYSQWDDLINKAATKYGVDPKLIKSVIWKESKFVADREGAAGERGLMQVMPAAGGEWAESEGLETFQPTDLWDPETNVMAGTWYLSRGLKRWTEMDDPTPFALAEYNAGLSRVDKWVKESDEQGQITGTKFRNLIPFPSTRQYVEDIMDRYYFYQHRQRTDRRE